MADPKFEDVKKEMRSLLISYQKGTSLSEFRKEYRSMIGRMLPFKEFGFKDEFSFLKAMPDVVKVYPSPVPGDYHLMGVADESIKHIQKMVCKQKASKHKTRYRAPKAVSYAYSSAPSYASNYGSSRTFGKNYVLPPRFSKKELPKGVDQMVVQMLDSYPFGLKLSQFLNAFCNHYKRQFLFKDWGFSTLEECLETIPGLNAKNKNNEIIVHLLKTNSEENRQTNLAPVRDAAISKDIISQPSKNLSQPSLIESSTLNPNAPDFFDRDFNKDESKSDSLQVNSSKATSDNFLINRMIQDSYSQSALEESRFDIEDPFQPNGQFEPSRPATSAAVAQRLVSSALGLKNEISEGQRDLDRNVSEKAKGQLTQDHDNQVPCNGSKADLLDDFPLINFKDEPAANNLMRENFNDVDVKYIFAFDSPYIKEPKNTSASGISKIVRNNLIKMIDNYPHGIFAVQFSSCYEKVTGTPFDLHSLGFTNLSELIDAVPDILVRKPYRGSKKDWIICSANSAINEATVEAGPAECSVLFVECVILNIRKILQANPEGIPISNFIHNYSINCTEPLYVRDLGFSNLEDFLLSIASRVPLEIRNVKGEKVVQFVSFQGIIKPPVSPLQTKPADIAPFDADFKVYELWENFDYDQFHPVYTSSIANPGLLYLQFEGGENHDSLKALYDLYDELDVFYHGKMSDLYRMKPADIKVGLACCAIWPNDKHWYRAKITSIVSLDFVQVFYQDYGTTDEIPMNMLRYIKKDYMALPTQAVKSCLAYLQPPPMPGQTSASWDKRIRRRMLELCQDRPLMAKIENIYNDRVLAVILCDTSKEEDLYINDVLIHEGLAVVRGENDQIQQPIPSPVPHDPQQLSLPQQLLSEIMSKLRLAHASNPTLAPPQDPQQILLELIAKFSFANASSSDLITMLKSLNESVLPNQTPFGFSPQQSLPPMSQQFPNIAPLVSPNFNAIPSFSCNSNFSATTSIQPPKYPPGLNIQIPEAASNAPKMKDISDLSPLDPSPPLTPSPDDGEIFDDDDDEYFEQLCQRNIDAKPRYVKRVKTTDGYAFHVLLYDSEPYISSGDISIVIWHAKNPSYLFHKLQAQEIELASMTLMESGNEEFFAQLERFKVKGVEKMGTVSSILLYPLSKANQILNLFGHPSATLRAKINTEIATFNPLSFHWQELPDSEIPEEVEDIRIVTDDDKMNRLCLYDLKTMREGIRCKRVKLVKRKEVERTNPELDEEINKLNQLSSKVRERITEIDQIIKMFSESKR